MPDDALPGYCYTRMILALEWAAMHADMAVHHRSMEIRTVNNRQIADHARRAARHEQQAAEALANAIAWASK